VELTTLPKREFDEAMALLADVPARCAAAKQIADACESYETTRVTALEEYNKVKDNPVVATEAEALDDKLTRASDLATNELRKFAEAKALLDQVIGEAKQAGTLADEQAKNTTATSEALSKEGIPQAIEALKQQIAALRLFLPQIEGLPAHVTLGERLTEIETELTNFTPPENATTDALEPQATKINVVGLDLRRLIDFDYLSVRKAAALKVTELETRSKDTTLATKVAEMKRDTLEAADSQAASGALVKALELLANVESQYEALKVQADKMDLYKVDHPDLTIKVNDLEPKRTHIGDEIDELLEKLRLAAVDADGGNFVDAVAKLEEIKKAIGTATALANVAEKIAADNADRGAVEALMAQPGGSEKLDALIESLPEKSRRDVMMIAIMVRFDIDEFKQFKTDEIWECHWAGCDGRNYEQDDACRTCGGSRNYWECDAGGCGDKNDWNDATCGGCGGSTGVDKFTESKSSYDTSRLEETDYTGKNKSYKKIYQLLKSVPDTHSKDNPSLKKIIFFREDTGGAAYGSGTVLLNCGRAGESTDYAESLLPGSTKHSEYFPAPDLTAPEGDPRRDVYVMDPDCLPKENTVTPGNKKPYFGWATLHEIGHAVDDAKGFMTKNGGKSEFGGWIEYGADVTKVAKAANGKFKFDLPYIEEKLIGNNPPLPPLPTDERNLTNENWLNLQTEVDDWCAGVRVGKDLWWDGANSAKLSIGGRVYQEAYDNQWVSYELSARNRGIHGYQFRAPGEWFAELYAAYHSGVLRDKHPSSAWLSKL
jgi:hypothetical protein